jgi:DNA-binding transcriptional ArsR family regulator
MERMTQGQARQGGTRVSDPRTMRALAHPARIEIVDYLTSSGASVTATECAELVGLSPSATSYHLRELAKYGLVEQAPSRGDGRERLWRSPGTGLRIAGESADPRAREAERALVDAYLTRDFQRIRDWAAREHDASPEWREAATLMSTQLLVTAAELAELNEQVAALLEPFKRRARQDGPPAGSRAVRVHYSAFPEV